MNFSNHPKKLYLEVTTRCNLHCFICVKYKESSCIKEEHFPLPLFEKIIPSLPTVKTLVLNGIGEPLMHPQLIDFIKIAKRHMPHEGSIGFQSNGLLLNAEMAENLIAAGLDTVCLSVDDITEGTDGKTTGHSFNCVQKAVRYLKEAKDKLDKSFKIGLEVVLSKSTISTLPQLVGWAGDNGLDYILATHLIQYDEQGEAENIFNPNEQQAVEIFNRLKVEAEKTGVDIAQAYKLYRSFAGTRSTQAEKRLFDNTLAESKEKNIRLNLPELLKQDQVDHQAIQTILDESRRIADQYNLQLKLPETATLNSKQCAFIEDEAVCISANGDVTPCHFLWHTYSCRMFGEDRPVMKKVLGNLASATLESIWQQPEYQSFRKEAGEYEYSPCWSCSQGPCVELIANDEDYAHDCHGSNVPCGHCQWSLGGIMCL